MRDPTAHNNTQMHTRADTDGGSAAPTPQQTADLLSHGEYGRNTKSRWGAGLVLRRWRKTTARLEPLSHMAKRHDLLTLQTTMAREQK